MNPNWLKGKTIAKVEMNPFDGGHRTPAHNPVISFTDGSYITFYTQETEGGEYGTGITFHKAKKK